MGYNFNFDLSVSVASRHREKKSMKTESKAQVHIAPSYHKAQGTSSFQNFYIEMIH